jgi:DNA repair photolyase
MSMRWRDRALDLDDGGALPGMQRLAGLLRTVTAEEFPGVRFHEVAARSALNEVPASSAMPFRWTVNPYRGCTHACVYCYARGTHAYLELDTGAGFDSELVVKVNVAQVLRRDLSRPSWSREQVALGTNTDPYQRAEGRYRLMPGVIAALADSGTPFSILTKGTILRRDLPLLADAAARVGVGLGVSMAILDEGLHQRLEPGTPSPRARLDLVTAIRSAGLECGVMLAPVLPGMTDDDVTLDATLRRIAAAGASGVTVLPLHLRPGAREWFRIWLDRERPDLVGRYRDLYRGGSYVRREYRDELARRVRPLVVRHGLAPSSGVRGLPGDEEAEFPAGSLPARPVSEPPTPRAAGATPRAAGATVERAAQLRLI